MRETTIAVVQMEPKLLEVGQNLIQMSDLVEKICMEQRVDLIVFPELITTGYECGMRFTQLAEKIPGHSVNLMAQLASQFSTHIVFSMASKEKVESVIYDSAIMVGPDGELVGEYRKVHLHGEEQMTFRPGFRFPVFDTAFGQVGIILGWDLIFPEAARSLALDGAEIICLCAAWERPHVEEWQALLATRALENSVFVAAADRIGQEPSYTFLGQSAVVGPRGELHTHIEEQAEGYAVATIDLDEVRQLREDHQTFQLRQPASYRTIVRKY